MYPIQMRFTFFCLLFVLMSRTAVYAQHDSSAEKGNDSSAADKTLGASYLATDSLVVAEENREQFVADSLAMIWLAPDSLRQNQFIKQQLKTNLADIDSILTVPLKNKGRFKNRPGS